MSVLFCHLVLWGRARSCQCSPSTPVSLTMLHPATQDFGLAEVNMVQQDTACRWPCHRWWVILTQLQMQGSLFQMQTSLWKEGHRANHDFYTLSLIVIDVSMLFFCSSKLWHCVQNDVMIFPQNVMAWMSNFWWVNPQRDNLNSICSCYWIPFN